MWGFASLTLLSISCHSLYNSPATQGRLDLLSCVEQAGWIMAADDLVQCVVLLKKIESEMQKKNEV